MSDDSLRSDELPVPSGFEHHEVVRAGWRFGSGDSQRHALSLVAQTADLSSLAQLPLDGLWKLACRHHPLTDAGIDYVVRFDCLEDLDLAHTLITDASTRAMHTLQKLRSLSVAGCAITDAGMEHIAALRALEYLDLSATQVTDEGLRALAFHPRLCVLNIRDSQVSGAALAPLLTLPLLRQISLNRHQHRHARQFARERPEVELLY